MYRLGEVDHRFPWAGVRCILAEGSLKEMVAMIRKHKFAERLRVWMPISNRWAMPYEAELLCQ